PRTDRTPLPGAVGWPADDDARPVVEATLAASGGRLSEASATLLANTYGMRAADLARRFCAEGDGNEPLIEGRPEVLAQVDWAIEEELAASVTDVLLRRTQLFFRDREQGLDAAPKIASRMAHRLGWDEAREREELAGYEAEVARSRAWRAE
ncbi:MAG: hypothetical protein OEY14_00235, partial [Myxococcales bacterium]|nr:hypothetical protein [Myxococcales bacterium]